VKAAIYDCARPVVIAPPEFRAGTSRPWWFAWNGSASGARRRVGHGLSRQGRQGTIVVADATPDEAGTPLWSQPRPPGIAATVDATKSGPTPAVAVVGLAGLCQDKRADLLVMGAYGHGELSNSGLGGAPAKEIAFCPVPLLLAH